MDPGGSGSETLGLILSYNTIFPMKTPYQACHIFGMIEINVMDLLQLLHTKKVF